MAQSRLVIGAGATGRTHTLTTWLAETDPGPVLTGSPLAAVTGGDVAAALADEPALIVADDVQWFDAAALDALIEASKTTAVLASRRPPSGGEPNADRLDLLAEILTRATPAERLGLLPVDTFAVVLAGLKTSAASRDGAATGGALATEEVDRLHAVTAGSVGLAADAVATGWDGDAARLPAGLVDAVNARIRRAGTDAATLVALWAVTGNDGADGLATALAALDPGVPADRAERAARAGGLLTDDGELIPLIQACAGADLTAAGRAALHDRIATALAAADRAAAADHLLAGAGDVPDASQILAAAALDLAVSDPTAAPRYIDRAEQLGLAVGDAALLRALGAFHAGSPDALAHLQEATAAGAIDTRSAVLGYGIDLRDLRFDDAAAQPIGGDLAAPLRSLAEGLAGRPADPSSVGADRTPLSAMVSGLASGVVALAGGRLAEAIGACSTAADDFDRLRPTAPFGVTPHAVGAMAALMVGDLPVVEILTEQAIEQRSGGTGEELTHRLLRAYGRLVGGDYTDALAVLRTHASIAADEQGAPAAEGIDDLDDVTGDVLAADGAKADAPEGEAAESQLLAGAGGMLCQRDRLLLASIEAAIARRSGDTTRLRAAWKRAEEALIRPSVSWMLTDPMTELLAAGARLGDERRTAPIVDALTEQGLALPESGPGPVAAHWLRLQISIASEAREQVTEAAQLLATIDAPDARSRARAAAGSIWGALKGVEGAAPPPGEEAVVEVAAGLSAVGDGWEASRLLGQAALDEADPKAARRMLELARTSATEHVEASTGDGLSALGLSERESEVALLVVEGRTHKEVGAQLFISPKTVEHHVAKIRQKVGASSRAELLSIIREAVGSS